MFEFLNKKKPERPKQIPNMNEPQKQPQVDSDLDAKVAALQNLILEQRQMIRKLLQITTMLSEHKRYELIQAELHKLSNMIDRIK